MPSTAPTTAPAAPPTNAAACCAIGRACSVISDARLITRRAAPLTRSRASRVIDLPRLIAPAARFMMPDAPPRPALDLAAVRLAEVDFFFVVAARFAVDLGLRAAAFF